MKHALIFTGLVLLVVAAWILAHHYGLPDRMNHVDYQGQRIKLSKYYGDYDDYKNDPDNIDSSETSRVQQLVSHAPIARTFSSRDEIAHAVIFDLKFPGYGLGSFSSKTPEADGSFLELFCIEIPRANQDRYLTFQGKSGRDGSYTQIDDFIETDDLDVVHLREGGGALVYNSRRGSRTLVRPLAKNP